MQIRPVLFKL